MRAFIFSVIFDDIRYASMMFNMFHGIDRFLMCLNVFYEFRYFPMIFENVPWFAYICVRSYNFREFSSFFNVFQDVQRLSIGFQRFSMFTEIFDEFCDC